MKKSKQYIYIIRILGYIILLGWSIDVIFGGHIDESQKLLIYRLAIVVAYLMTQYKITSLKQHILTTAIILFLSSLLLYFYYI